MNGGVGILKEPRKVAADKHGAFRHTVAITLPICWIVLLSFNLSNRPANFYYDSHEYWRLAHSYVRLGHFDLFSFTGTYRGYLLPLLYLPVIEIARLAAVREVTAFVAASAIVYSTLFTIVWPWAIRRLFGYRMGALETLVWAGLVILFWRGHLLFPLSDFPTLFIGITAVACFKGFLDTRDVRWMLASGLTAGLASNARPMYELVFACLFTWALVRIWKSAHWRNAVVALIAYILGAMIALLPQAAINIAFLRTASPFIQTQAYQGKSLFAQQLFWGIGIQRYETVIGRFGNQVKGRAVFLDSAGAQILRDEKIVKEVGLVLPDAVGFSTYAALAARYPLFFAGLYPRHLFNALDLTYPTPYVLNPFSRPWPFRSANYLIWYLLLVLIVTSLRSRILRDHGTAIALCTILCFPGLLSVPGAVETRFLLPMYVLGYSALIMGRRRLIALRHRSLVAQVLLATVLVIGLFLAHRQSDRTFRSLQTKAPTLTTTASLQGWVGSTGDGPGVGGRGR